MGIEIEKKYLVKEIPKDIDKYPYHVIEQGYLNVSPAIRVRREDDRYYMTYKAAQPETEGDIGKAEYNLSLDEESYAHMVRKADGIIIRKKRYLIPLNEDAYDKAYLEKCPDLAGQVDNGDIKIELDVFMEPFEGRILAEVEFPDEDAAKNYKPAAWFAEDVTGDRRYSNAYMSTAGISFPQAAPSE